LKEPPSGIESRAFIGNAQETKFKLRLIDKSWLEAACKDYLI
jgi:hypothetical protein